jgi:hypothetical protein
MCYNINQRDKNMEVDDEEHNNPSARRSYPYLRVWRGEANSNFGGIG